MPCILVWECDIRQPIPKQYLQSSTSKCERQFNSQHHTDTERSCIEEEEGGLLPIKQNSRLAPHLPRLGVIFDGGNFQLCSNEIGLDQVSRPQGLGGCKWLAERRQLRALIGIKWGRGSLWLRRFYTPCKAM